LLALPDWVQKLALQLLQHQMHNCSSNFRFASSSSLNVDWSLKYVHLSGPSSYCAATDSESLVLEELRNPISLQVHKIPLQRPFIDLQDDNECSCKFFHFAQDLFSFTWSFQSTCADGSSCWQLHLEVLAQLCASLISLFLCCCSDWKNFCLLCTR
jgi:hypothetical protein